MGFNSQPGTRNPERGFSLVEAIVFIVIVSIALAGVLSVMNFTTQRSADPLIRKQAIAVAESLLEEISLRNFTVGGYTCVPTPCTQADRQSLDDIVDYNGFATTGVFPIDSGLAVPGLSGYTVLVTVTPTALGPVGNMVPASASSLITVTVTGPDAVPIALSGYRTAYGS